jgi:hypothetical protein
MGELATLAFWQAALERAIKSFAGGLLAAFGSDALSITDLRWGQAFGVAAFTALSSILLSIVSASIGNPGPSLGPEVLRTNGGKHGSP